MFLLVPRKHLPCIGYKGKKFVLEHPQKAWMFKNILFASAWMGEDIILVSAWTSKNNILVFCMDVEEYSFCF